MFRPAFKTLSICALAASASKASWRGSIGGARINSFCARE